MRINEILIESQQLQEGPMLNKIGSAVGKGVGTLAKGVGAVAGGVAGLGKAIKKGYQAGKQTVGGGGDDNVDAAEPTDNTATSTAPAQRSAPGASAPATRSAPQTTAAPAQAQQPAQQSTPAPAAGSTYKQVQAAVAALPPAQKKQIVTMLQKDPKVQAAMNKTAQAKPAPAAQQPTPAPAAPAQPAAQPATVSVEPAPVKKNKAAPKKSRKPSQAEIDADRERLMGVTSDSVIRKGAVVAESFSYFRPR